MNPDLSGSAPADPRSDAALLMAHVAGDPEAFTALIRRHESYLWAVALRTTRDPDDAADALQDALLNAHRKAGDFRGDSQVRSWLHRILVNACLDRIRRIKLRQTLPLPDQDTMNLWDGIDQTGHLDLRLDIGRAIGSLPEDQRAAIVAVDIEGLTVAEAADRLGVAAGTIKSRCARGRAKLAVLLGHLKAPSE